MKHTDVLSFATVATLLLPGFDAVADPIGPKIVAARSAEFAIGTAAVDAGLITQFSFGPDGRLYASTIDRGVVSFRYDAASGALTDRQSASNVSGAGIAFQQGTGQMYVSSPGEIYRLSDENGNGKYGETRVAIVQNLPIGDHMNDNIQIIGDTLYIGLGDRTLTGGTGEFTGGAIDDYGGQGMYSLGKGNTFGESAYNGTIAQIRDLRAVASTPNAAGLFADTSRTTIQTNDTPFTSTDPRKLTVHSAGARNPFGLAVDRFGDLYFTNNFIGPPPTATAPHRAACMATPSVPTSRTTSTTSSSRPSRGPTMGSTTTTSAARPRSSRPTAPATIGSDRSPSTTSMRATRIT